MMATKVLFVSSHSRDGGSETYLLNLLEELGATWVAGVVCLEQGPFVERLRGRRLSPEVLQTGGSSLQIAVTAWKLRSIVRRIRPDVIHANGIKAALVAVLAVGSSRVPVVWVKHDFSWDGRLAAFIGHRCQQIVGVSTAVTRTFASDLKRRIHVVPPGIAESLLTPGRAHATEELASPVRKSEETVLLVGRLDPLKGHIEAVEIAPQVLRRRRDVVFLLVGPESPDYPHFREQLEERINDLGLDDTVRILGFRPDAVALMARSDVVLMPSLARNAGADIEGAPLAALEAMAVGATVVGYAVGGLPEVLGDCGILVPAGDRRALADQVVEALADATLRRNLGSCGRQRVRTLFTLPQTARAMKERYREAAMARAGR